MREILIVSISAQIFENSNNNNNFKRRLRC